MILLLSGSYVPVSYKISTVVLIIIQFKAGNNCTKPKNSSVTQKKRHRTAHKSIQHRIIKLLGISPPHQPSPSKILFASGTISAGCFAFGKLASGTSPYPYAQWINSHPADTAERQSPMVSPA